MAFLVTLASGSSGNCALVSDGKTHVLIDAGISARRIAAKLAGFGIAPSELSAVLVTHEHSDHISGLPVLLKRAKAPVYATAPTLDAIWGLPEELKRPVEPYRYFAAGGFYVLPFLTPHDSAMSSGFRIELPGKSLSVATDLGHVPDEVLGAVMGSDTVLFEANHDEDMLRFGRYPAFLKRRIACDTGHLSNAASARALCRIAQSGARSIVLCHLSKENNTPEIAYSTVASGISGEGGCVGGDVCIYVSPADDLGSVITL